MVSVKRISGRVAYLESKHRRETGSSVDEAIGRIALRSVRFGPRIMLDQLADVPKDAPEQELLEAIESELEAKREPLSPRKLRRLEAKAKVLQITGGLRGSLGGRSPTVYQVLAVPAIKFGLNSIELDEISTSMNTLTRSYPSQVTWIGKPTSIRSAIKHSLPSTIEQILFNEKKALNSSEIDEKIGDLDIEDRLNPINSALQLLEVAGFVRKQPEQVVPGLEEQSVWSHKAFPNPFPIHENPRIYVLKQLYNEGNPKKCLTTEFYKEYVGSSGDKYGNPNAPYDHVTIYSNIRYLQECELIQTETVRIQERRGTAELTEVALTQYGERVLKRMYKYQSLPEELRKLLLGEKKG